METVGVLEFVNQDPLKPFAIFIGERLVVAQEVPRCENDVAEVAAVGSPLGCREVLTVGHQELAQQCNPAARVFIAGDFRQAGALLTGAAHLVVKALNLGRYLLLAKAVRAFAGEQFNRLVAIGAVEQINRGRAESTLPQRCEVGLLDYFKGRIDASKQCMAAEKTSAEAVDRGYPSSIKFRQRDTGSRCKRIVTRPYR